MAARLAERIRKPLGGLDQAATRIEELLARGEGGFLSGNLLAIMNAAVLRQMRGEVAEALASARAGRDEPSDAVDEADFFASTVGELAALLKLLAGTELQEQPELRGEWERLSDQLLTNAAELQQAVEEFEVALEAAEPDEEPEEAPTGLRPANPELLRHTWQKAQAGAALAGAQARLAQVMREHPEYQAAFERPGEAGPAAEGVNPFLHVALHVAVETQLETGEPAEAAETLERLMAAGLTRHQALHRIGAAFTEEIAEMQRQGRPFDRAGYARRLQALTHPP